jgi:hypothetical protein
MIGSSKNWRKYTLNSRNNFVCDLIHSAVTAYRDVKTVLSKYIYKQFIIMTDAEDLLKVLQEWREQPGKTITSVLTRIEESKQFKGREL